MKDQKGFTLVELVIVVAIIGIVLTMATLNFNRMNEKYRVESNIKTIHTILMKARNEANSTNIPQGVELAAGQVKSGAYDTTAAFPPLTFIGTTTTTNFQQFTIDFAGPVRFDRRGLTNDNQTIRITSYPNDVSPAMDCIVVSATRINMGKWTKPGGPCVQR